jgi:hypothetical protein
MQGELKIKKRILELILNFYSYFKARIGLAKAVLMDW